jgi:hypothetical protein
MQAVFNVRREPTAEASLAAIFARSKLGMAMAAMIRIIATTIKSSISEKPLCLLRMGAMLHPEPPERLRASLSFGFQFSIFETQLAPQATPLPGQLPEGTLIVFTLMVFVAASKVPVISTFFAPT